MANNGKMIVYNTTKTTGAMAAAMGLFDKGVSQKKRVDKENSNFKSKENTPTTPQTRPNVNYEKKNYKTGQTYNKNQNGYNGKTKVYNPNWKPKQRVLSPEEKREKDIKTTLDALEIMMIDVGDEFTKMKGRNYRVKTGVADPYGGEVVLRVYQDDGDPTDIITVFDDDGVFNDFVAEHDSEQEIWDEIRKICLRKGFYNLRGIHGNKNGNPDCYLQIKGKVEDYVYMKWELLDVLRMVYDSDEELREAIL